MKTGNQSEEMKLIKHLITGDRVLCPKCARAELVHFHKKAKKAIPIGNVLLVGKDTRSSG